MGALVKVGDLNVAVPIHVQPPTGPLVRNEFERIDLSPRLNVVIKVLDGFKLPKMLPEWPGVPDVAREPLFWVHAFLFVTCEYGISMVVNRGEPWWLEKLLMSLAWGALLACLPSAAALLIRRIWGTRLRVFPVQNMAVSGSSCVGQLCISCAEKASEGWLLCDGRPVSRQLFSQLFAAIQTTFGEGDGTTTFNLPDLQGRVAVGQAPAGSAFIKLGEFGGEAMHILTCDEMPAHTHSVHDQGHTHYVMAKGRKYVGDGRRDFAIDRLGESGPEGDGSGHTDVAHSNVSVSSAGGGVAHNNMPPYIVVSYLIKC